MRAESTDEYRLSIDFISCKGHGICAYLLPGHLGLDEWGYPVVIDGSLERGQLRQAKRAALLCPEMAVRIERIQARPRAARR